MAHQLENMAYVGATPWHGLGNKLTTHQPLEVWQHEAGMNWQIEESPVRFLSDSTAHLGSIHTLPEQKPIPKPKAPASEETIEKQADFRADKALEPECHQAGSRLEETNTSQASSSPAATNEPEQRSLAVLDERPEWQKKRDSIIGRPKT